MMNKDTHFLDFEFRPKANHNELVCCCVLSCEGGVNFKKKEFWLNDGEGTSEIVNFFLDKKGQTLVAFAAQAEIDCFLDLGLNPYDFEWLCLFNWGKPWFYSSSSYNLHFENCDEWEPVKPVNYSKKNNVKKRSDLVSFLSFFCGFKRDVLEKKDNISLILKKNRYTIYEKRKILDYCWEDVEQLPSLYAKLKENEKSYVFKNGKTLIQWSQIQRRGIPLNKLRLDTFVGQIPDIKKDVIENVNQMCLTNGMPEIFVLEKGFFKEKNVNITEIINKLGLTSVWPKTETGHFKTDRETTKQFESYEVIDRWRRTKQLLCDIRMLSENTLKNDKKTFWSYISQTKYGYRQHPWYNAFGSISGRFQPSAISFIYAQPSWMRIFIDPDPHTSILSVDFSAQEIWIAGVLSNDYNLLQDYGSEDVYLSFAKSINYVPQNATAKTHSAERNVCKSVVLGLQYGMGNKKLSSSLGVSSDEASFLISSHKKRYWRFWKWRQSYIKTHEITGKSFLSDESWVLLDNRAHKTGDVYARGEHYALTTGNFPVQGMGASILRHAVCSLFNDVNIISTVHDEINFEVKTSNILHLKNLFDKYMEKFSAPFYTPLKYEYSVQNHGDLLIKSKGKNALKRLSKYMGLDI